MRNLALLSALVLAACTGDMVAPTELGPTGTVHLQVALSAGGTPDLRGFEVAVGPNTLGVPPNGIDLFFPQIPAGRYSARVDSLDPWCSASTPDSSYLVPAGDTISLRYRVDCDTLRSTVRVIVRTTSVDLGDPDGYRIVAAGEVQTVAQNDTTYFSPPAWGATEFVLDQVAPWCQSPSTVQSAPFRQHDTLTVTFEVGCASIYAAVPIITSVAGEAPPSDTVRIRSSGDPGSAIRLTLPDSIRVRLDQPWIAVQALPSTCVDLDADSMAVPVTFGQPAAPVVIPVGCGTVTVFRSAAYGWPTPPSPAERLTVGLDGRQVQVTGSGLIGVALPALSPNGSTLAGTTSEYDFGAAKWRYTLAVQPAGGGVAQFPQAGSAEDSAWHYPTWNHDGTRLIGYIRDADGAIHHVSFDPTGQGLDTLTLPPNAYEGAVESPDGQFLAFARLVGGYPGGQLVIARAGDTVPVESYPVPAYASGLAWSPDGTRLAFVAGSIWTLQRGSGDLTRLAFPPDSTNDAAPQWSADGKLIVFRRFHCCTAEPYWLPAVVRSTGGPVREASTVKIWGGPFWPR